MKFDHKAGNQYQLLGRVYKKTLKRRAEAVEYEDYKKTGDGGAVAITIKLDGEFAVPALESNGEAKVYSPGERNMIRWDFEAVREMKASLEAKGYSSGVFYAELYGVDTKGLPIKFNKTIPLIYEVHGQDTDREVRLGVFDIESLDGKKVDEPGYWKRYELIHHLFGGNTYCHPVVAVEKGGADLFEKYVNSMGFEGLVVRMDHKILKVKNLFTFDAVIYAIQKKGERMKMNPPRFGSVRVGLFLPNGDLIDMGSVGNGWDDDERLALHMKLMADMFDEDGKNFYVRPKHIIEVGYTEMMSEKMVPNFGPVATDSTVNIGSRQKARAYGPRFPKRIQYVSADGLIGDYPMISDNKKQVTEADLGIRQVPELADIYDVPETTPKKQLTPRAAANISQPAIVTDETTKDVKRNTDFLGGTAVVREDIPDVLDLIGPGGVKAEYLAAIAKVSVAEIRKWLTVHEKAGDIMKAPETGLYYRIRGVSKPSGNGEDPSELVQESQGSSVGASKPPEGDDDFLKGDTYEALLVSDVDRKAAEAAQTRRHEYWKKVLPYILEKTMGRPLALVNFSKNSGSMPLVRRNKGEPIIIEKKSEIREFMTRTGKFEKAGTRAFSRGLITVYYVPSVTGKDIRTPTLDFDIEDIDEREARPFVALAVALLKKQGFVAMPFFTGSSWHVPFRKKDCSIIGEYGGVHADTGIVADIILPIAEQIELDIRGAAAHIADKVTLDYAVNKANGPIRFPLSLHKKGLVMIPVNIGKLNSFDPAEAHPDNVLKNLGKYKKVIDRFYIC